MTDAEPRRDLVPLREATKAWFRISLQTFGGPAGQIAVMQHEIVDERRWLGERRFLHALSYCMPLPGPEAHQLAIYTGWLLNGGIGGLIAGALFVLPGLLVMLAMSIVYVAYGETELVVAVFAGLAPAVLAIVAQAVVKVGRRALRHPTLVVLAVASFAAIALLGLPFPVVIAAAAAAGWVLGRYWPATMAGPSVSDDTDDHVPVVADGALHHADPSLGRTLTVLWVGLLVWLLPVALAYALVGPGSTLAQQGTFFSGTALVTFGGAYAVLAYIAQRAVEDYGWLQPGEMVRGLALAETTPGPLIMVVQFVAFIGAYRDPGTLNPWIAATVAALLTTWVTFVPSFLFIFLGAPYVERLRSNAMLSAALTGITAAVVGVIANLGLYFALHTLFDTTTTHEWGPLGIELPDPAEPDITAFLVTAVAAILLFRTRLSTLKTIGVCALVGAAITLAT
ncbi:MAG: chromate efflux transporter [Nocardioidaceae bacterium]